MFTIEECYSYNSFHFIHRTKKLKINFKLGTVSELYSELEVTDPFFLFLLLGWVP